MRRAPIDRVGAIHSASIVVAIAAAFIAACAGAAEPSADTTTSRAEIQFGLCSSPEEVVRALNLKARGPKTEVWMFDDAALSLFERGLRFRLRVADGRSELTLKVADQDCANVPMRFLPRNEGKCEYDLHGTTIGGAVSLANDVRDREALLSGRTPLAAALSPAQLRYLQERLNVWPLPADLRALGPIALETYRTPDKTYDVDISRLPNGTAYVEISTKVPLAKVPGARGTLERELERAGVAVCADQSGQAVNKLKALLQ